MSQAIQRTTEYKLNKTIFRVMYGDITKLEVDAIVSSDDTCLSMAGGVSEAILVAGGETIQREAKRLTPLEVGDVVVTSAGQLPAKYVLHAATIDYRSSIFPSEDIIRTLTTKCLRCADGLSANSIAFPALGTGVGHFSFKSAADAMTSAIADYLMSGTQLKLVVLTLFAREIVSEEDLNLFYERAVAKASVHAQLRQLESSVDKLEKSMKTKSTQNATSAKEPLSERFDSLKKLVKSIDFKPIILAAAHLPGTIGYNQELEKLTDEAISISSRIEDNFPDKSSQLNKQALSTKREGFKTKLITLTSDVNNLEIQESEYKLSLRVVPSQLAEQIESKKIEISEIQKKLKQGAIVNN